MKLIANNIHKKIKGKTILNDISLEMETGNIYGFWGRNGSGKTMLFRALSGLMKIDSGNIYWNDKELHKDFAVLPSQGIVLEHAGLYPNKTGAENLLYLAQLKGVIGKREVEEAIQRVGLDPADKRVFGKYSMGMKQRLVIAQAIMEKPDVIMLDEPTNGLDEAGIKEIRQLIEQEKERGALILLASHNQDDMKILADQVYKIADGRKKGERTVKCKWGLCFILFIVIVITVFGIFEKRTYTNIAEDKSYLDELYVAQLPENICLEETENLSVNLPQVPVIIRVSVLGDVEHIGGTSRQLVKVEDVYKGTEPAVGQDLYLPCSRWSLSLYSEPYSIERGFVNIMEVGGEYLVFIENQVDGLGEKIPVYQVYVENAFTPIFSYQKHENNI